MRTCSAILVALLAPFFVGACGAPPSDGLGDNDLVSAMPSETRFDAIDAAMLFPLDAATIKLADNANPKPGAAPVTLLTKTQFDQARGLVEHESASDFGSWRVVGFRFAPCATSTPTTTDCRITMRIVVQPLSATGADDHALHLIYELGAGDDRAVVKELAALKASCQKSLKTATNGSPVGLHPCFALPSAKRAPFVKTLNDIILSHASQEKLIALSAMFTQGAQDSWFFGAAQVVNGAVVQVPIPTLVDPSVKDTKHPEAIHQTFSDSSPLPTGPRNGEIHPAAFNPAVDRLGIMVNDRSVRSALGPSGSAVDLKAVKDGVHAAVRIANPKLHDVFTATCADCHMGSRSIALVQAAAGDKFDSLFDVKTDAFIVPPQVTAAVPPACGQPKAPAKSCRVPDDTNYVVKAFAYHGAHLTVIPRVANEAAAVASFINAKLLPPL